MVWLRRLRGSYDHLSTFPVDYLPERFKIFFCLVGVFYQRGLKYFLPCWGFHSSYNPIHLTSVCGLKEEHRKEKIIPYYVYFKTTSCINLSFSGL